MSARRLIFISLLHATTTKTMTAHKRQTLHIVCVYFYLQSHLIFILMLLWTIFSLVMACVCVCVCVGTKRSCEHNLFKVMSHILDDNQLWEHSRWLNIHKMCNQKRYLSDFFPPLSILSPLWVHLCARKNAERGFPRAISDVEKLNRWVGIEESDLNWWFTKKHKFYLFSFAPLFFKKFKNLLSKLFRGNVFCSYAKSQYLRLRCGWKEKYYQQQKDSPTCEIKVQKGGELRWNLMDES